MAKLCDLGRILSADIRPLTWLLVCIFSVGCQMGSTSVELRKDKLIPSLDIHRVPDQWEPKVEEADFEDNSRHD